LNRSSGDNSEEPEGSENKVREDDDQNEIKQERQGIIAGDHEESGRSGRRPVRQEFGQGENQNKEDKEPGKHSLEKRAGDELSDAEIDINQERREEEELV